MNEARMPRNLPLLLLQAREAVISHFRPLLNHAGVTEQQWRILRALCELGELEPRQLCEICQILSPSLTGVLARMEETGLVARRKVDSDQRRLLVSPTAKGKALVKRMAPLVTEQYRLLEDALGPELVRDLYGVLDRLVAVKDVPVARVPLSAARPAGRRKERAGE
ncbi:MAG TPA: homoprotocatechuate degradation operon regulator HpaR [Rhodocyclaceae bacterium]|nr:homoprotocatechuate degradation operon regulator HpaR [Rhodocyclaceae bacterium]